MSHPGQETAFAILALACTACGAGSAADAHPPPAAAPQAVVAAPQAIPLPASASTVGQAAVPPVPPRTDGPHLTLDATSVRVDGTFVADLSSSPPGLHVVDPLRDHLQARRAQAGPPSGDGACTIEVAPEVPFSIAASVIMTAQLAGHPSTWIPSDHRGWLKLRTNLPHPPIASPYPGAPPPPSTSPRRQLAVHVTPARLDLAAFTVVPRADRAGRKPLEPLLQRSLTRAAAASRELPDAFNEMCLDAARPCPHGVWLTADPGVLYGQTIPALGALAALQKEYRAAPEETPAYLMVFTPQSARPLGERVGLTLQPPVSSGRLDPEAIQPVVRRQFRALTACFEEGTQRDANLAGLVRIQLAVGKDGRVTKATAAPAPRPAPTSAPLLPDQAVVACIAQAFSALTFEPLKGGPETVTLSMVFSQSD